MSKEAKTLVLPVVRNVICSQGCCFDVALIWFETKTGLAMSFGRN